MNDCVLALFPPNRVFRLMVKVKKKKKINFK